MVDTNIVSTAGRFEFRCIDRYGHLKWADEAVNLVVNIGLQHMLDVTFTGATQESTWYVGLTAADPVVASANTLASHAGWTELTGYTGSRQEYVDVRSDQAVTNSASQASFAITTAQTVGGAFLASDATGTDGILLCAAALSGSNRSVVDGDTVNLTYTFTAAAS